MLVNDDNIVEPMMVALKDALCGEPFNSMSFIFYNVDDKPLCEILITDFLVDGTNKNIYYFIGEDGTRSVMGEITAGGTASYFKINNFDGDLCFTGSVGESGDVGADIRFNDRDWTLGDVITLSELMIRFDMGASTLIA